MPKLTALPQVELAKDCLERIKKDYLTTAELDTLTKEVFDKKIENAYQLQSNSMQIREAEKNIRSENLDAATKLADKMNLKNEKIRLFALIACSYFFKDYLEGKDIIGSDADKIIEAHFPENERNEVYKKIMAVLGEHPNIVASSRLKNTPREVVTRWRELLFSLITIKELLDPNKVDWEKALIGVTEVIPKLTVLPQIHSAQIYLKEIKNYLANIKSDSEAKGKLSETIKNVENDFMLVQQAENSIQSEKLHEATKLAAQVSLSDEKVHLFALIACSYFFKDFSEDKELLGLDADRVIEEHFPEDERVKVYKKIIAILGKYPTILISSRLVTSIPKEAVTSWRRLLQKNYK